MEINIPVKKYKDVDFRFEKNSNGDVKTISDEDSVIQSVKNIILTMHHERVFNPFFGSNIRRNLFDTNYPSLSFEVKNLVLETLSNYEPRISNIKVDTTAFENSLSLSVQFSIISISKTTSINIDLERLR